MVLRRTTSNPNSGKRRFRLLAAFAVGLLIAYTVMIGRPPTTSLTSS